MYELIQGTLLAKEPLRAVVETGGIAYRISIGLNTYTRLPGEKGKVLLYLSHIVREDLQALYGFVQKEERDLFETLLTISGVGPKTALALVGHLDLPLFYQAIHSADTRLLSKIPGIGKKTAERIIIELKDKLHPKKGKNKPSVPTGLPPLHADAVSALIHLGYAPQEAHEAVEAALAEQDNSKDLGKLISSALQKATTGSG
jgi:Holliday junction DNA helicase RuvA